MSWLWISLPEDWSRENVLASTAVVIQVLSMASSFIFIRAIWLGQARRFLYARTAPLRSLLTIGTIGEAGDIIALLRNGLLKGAHTLILCQCLLVIYFVIVAALAAPFAKLATRRWNITREQSVTGYVAETEWANTGPYPAREYDSIYASLVAVDFPLNQLLDFLPDTSVPWRFEENQWANHSWKMDCQTTENTTARLRTAHAACTAPKINMDPWPNIGVTFNISAYDQYVFHSIGTGFVPGKLDTVHNLFLLVAGMKSWDWDDDLKMNKSLSVLLASYAMIDVPLNVTSYTNNFICETLDGWIGSTKYSKIECHLEYVGSIHSQGHNKFRAFPDVPGDVRVAQDMMPFFGVDVEQKYDQDQEAYPVPPLDLIRTYQTYLIYKDTRRRKAVERSLNVLVKLRRSQPYLLLLSAFSSAVLWQLPSTARSHIYATARSSSPYPLRSSTGYCRVSKYRGAATLIPRAILTALQQQIPCSNQAPHGSNDGASDSKRLSMASES